MRIAVTSAEPSSPSPTQRQFRPGAMPHPPPNAEPEADSRRTSVDLQTSLSVHFESSFDLLKVKVSLPEHDSLGDLDMDMSSLAIKAPERGIRGRMSKLPKFHVAPRLLMSTQYMVPREIVIGDIGLAFLPVHFPHEFTL